MTPTEWQVAGLDRLRDAPKHPAAQGRPSGPRYAKKASKSLREFQDTHTSFTLVESFWDATLFAGRPCWETHGM